MLVGVYQGGMLVGVGCAVCGMPSCLLGGFSEVVLGFPTEVDVRVCLRLVRLVYVRLADPVDS